MTTELKTETARVSPFKKAIVGLTIAATVSGISFTGEYYLDPDINIYTEKLTGYEYSQLKTELVANVKNKKEMSYKDVAMWIDIFNKEIAGEKCKLQNITSENLVESLNNIIELGCP